MEIGWELRMPLLCSHSQQSVLLGNDSLLRRRTEETSGVNQPQFYYLSSWRYCFRAIWYVVSLIKLENHLEGSRTEVQRYLDAKKNKRVKIATLVVLLWQQARQIMVSFNFFAEPSGSMFLRCFRGSFTITCIYFCWSPTICPMMWCFRCIALVGW